MKIQLFPFQQTASDSLLAEITKAQMRFDGDSEILGAVVLEAATGAGKTVIAASVLSQLLVGSDQVPADPEAVILWVTNDPNLNEQTARKIQDASEDITDIRFIRSGGAFSAEYFEPGAIYFLNTQNASSTALITKKSEKQNWTIWETVSNSVERFGSSFVVVVDEAHYGMTERPGGSPTVLNKIINGDRPIPVFVGISATAERLNQALDGQQSRLKKNVLVPITAVRDSGLVKDRIVLAPASESGEVVADTTFVRIAVKKTLEYEEHWSKYAVDQGEPAVVPALVIQLPDEGSTDVAFKELLETVIDAVVQEWSGLKTTQIVHTFADRAPIELGASRVVTYMPPQDIQDAKHVRVILAKNAVTTGWDCPRAEVLVSLRASTDPTPIAQLIGRIVRQPLARRIASDESLNRVHAYLPRFDRETVMAVVAEFSGGEAGSTSEIVRLTLDYASPESMSLAIAALADLPSYVVPSQAASPEVRRLHALATLLDNDGLRVGATLQATDYLNGKLDNEKDKLSASGELEPRRTAVSTVAVAELLSSIDGDIIDGETSLPGVRMDAKNIDDVFKRASRNLRDGVAEAYWAHLVDADGDMDPLEAKVTVTALGLTEQVIANVESAAASLLADWLKGHAKAISLLPEADRARYVRIQGESRDPSLIPSVTVNGTIEESVSITASEDLSDSELREKIAADKANRWPRHLYQDSGDALYWKAPKPTDGLERQVLTSELKEPNLVGWYRNPPGGDRTIRIPYRDTGSGKWAGLHPDFIVFHQVGDEVRASIVDPHGIQLEDWADKLRGYVAYADSHADAFRAIQPITEIDGKLLFLALHVATTRSTVAAALAAGDSVEAIFREHGIAY